MEADSIANWDVTQLTKFIQNMLEQFTNAQTANKIYEQLNITRKLTIADEIQFAQPFSTVGVAGSAAALPATPEVYVKVLDPSGNVRQIPLYRIA